jgi:hypothetical protein
MLHSTLNHREATMVDDIRVTPSSFLLFDLAVDSSDPGLGNALKEI